MGPVLAQNVLKVQQLWGEFIATNGYGKSLDLMSLTKLDAHEVMTVYCKEPARSKRSQSFPLLFPSSP